MLVDLHVHTYPASDCSQIVYRDLIAYCAINRVAAIAVTNHGNVEDNRRLEEPLAEIGTVLVHGVEISTLFGDFVVFSPDLDWLASFHDVQAVPKPSQIPDGAAVVWVHPAAGGGRSGSSYYSGLAEQVAGFVDAVEVYNGTWTGRHFVETARGIAQQLRVAATGGSDAHAVAQFGRCATEIPGSVSSTADVVAALRNGETTPVTLAPPRRRFGGLLGRA